jgi:parvulin-like peptidyl-prolyl isomerase
MRGKLRFRKEKKMSSSTRTIALVLALILVAGCSGGDRRDLVIADVGPKEITIGDMEDISEHIENRYLPDTDDMEGKKKLLDNMINKEIMALKAIDMGYDKDDWFVDLWRRFETNFLQGQLMQHVVVKNIEVSDEEVDAYWQQMHYEYHLSQILVIHHDEAVALRERIMAGENFAELAKLYSFGPEAENGGNIGSNVIGRMFYYVEEVLEDMEEGEISEPIQIPTGWALIKIRKKRLIEPPLTQEYARKRVRAIKEKKGIQALKHQIEEDIELQFFPDAVNIAYEALPEDVDMMDILEYKVTRENAPKVEVPDQYKDMLICQFVDGSYTLQDFVELYDVMGLPERPRRDQGKKGVTQAIHMDIFDQVLPVYAKEVAKILEIPEVKEAYNQRKEIILVEHLYNDQVRDEVSVTTQEMRDYYDEHKEELAEEKREFTVLLVRDKALALDLHQQALEGEDFDGMVKKHSEVEEMGGEFGRSGLVSRGELPEYDAAFTLEEIGSFSEPFITTRGWAVVRLDGMEESEMKTFQEAQKKIKKIMLEERYEAHLKMKLAKWREDYEVKIYESNLKKAELKRTKSST